jgi:hypothetical protein
MLVITTTDSSGEAGDRMLARMETDGKLYVSAHHWSRGWYKRALENPQVGVEIDGADSNCTAVPPWTGMSLTEWPGTTHCLSRLGSSWGSRPRGTCFAWIVSPSADRSPLASRA